ncbi:MAG TPA: S8 family serine peptidase [Gaiellaceae bacterium]|nr:S8 family serine peptidase [Gaiellaceae bacterium]
MAWPKGTAVVTYESKVALAAALAENLALVVRRLPSLRAVEVLPAGDVARFAAEVSGLPGIDRVERRLPRRPLVEPALAVTGAAGPLQWQFAATRIDLVPESVLRAAASQTVAVIDTGADLGAPDLAAKTPLTHSVRTRSGDVSDRNGHGTFVASLAGGARANGEGIAGSGGDARLVIVQAGGSDGSFSDVEEAAAIVWAVDHGARILNLSLGGPDTSVIERRAVDYAVSKGALLVAAVGNGYDEGSPLEYPAALLQPPGSRGAGGVGLAVAASTRSGARARFSTVGTSLSLAAPGDSVFAAPSPRSHRRLATPERRFPAPPPGCTGTAAEHPSPRRRWPVPQRSSGRRTPACGRTRWPRSSSKPPPARAPGTPSSGTASSMPRPRWRRPRARKTAA